MPSLSKKKHDWILPHFGEGAGRGCALLLQLPGLCPWFYQSFSLPAYLSTRRRAIIRSASTLPPPAITVTQIQYCRGRKSPCLRLCLDRGQPQFVTPQKKHQARNVTLLRNCFRCHARPATEPTPAAASDLPWLDDWRRSPRLTRSACPSAVAN